MADPALSLDFQSDAQPEGVTFGAWLRELDGIFQRNGWAPDQDGRSYSQMTGLSCYEDAYKDGDTPEDMFEAECDATAGDH